MGMLYRWMPPQPTLAGFRAVVVLAGGDTMTEQEAFDLINEQVSLYKIGNRTVSAALLAWFLENVWRLDPAEVDDSICDGRGDKGIDAIVVDEDLREITVLQSKRRESIDVTQGDNDLKNLVGSAVYFESAQGVRDLLASSPAQELVDLIHRLDLEDILEKGDYTVRLVFVTNANSDGSAVDYLSAIADREPPLELWTRHPLAENARRTAHPGVLDEQPVLTSNFDLITHTFSDGRRMALGLFSAEELVDLPGIEDLTVFDPNVRLDLGRTRINKDLRRTVSEEPGQHDQFPAFHNGLTLITKGLTVDGRTIALDGVSVVNGCQSLIALHSSKAELTPELSLVTKFVEIGDNPQLGSLITYRSNNQNPVDMRDQRSTDRIQRDLQATMAEGYGDRLFLNIRNGEEPTAPETLDNRVAAQLIMAIWLEEPWAAVRKVRLFDQDYGRVFSRHTTAERLFLAHELNKLVEARRSDLVPELSASFASVRFTLIYLVSQLVRQSEFGAGLFDQPGEWLPEQLDEVLSRLDDFVDEAIQSVNFHVQSAEEEAEEEGTTYDPKVAFKSREGVRALEQSVMTFSRRLAKKEFDTYDFDVAPSQET